MPFAGRRHRLIRFIDMIHDYNCAHFTLCGKNQRKMTLERSVTADTSGHSGFTGPARASQARHIVVTGPRCMLHRLRHPVYVHRNASLMPRRPAIACIFVNIVLRGPCKDQGLGMGGGGSSPRGPGWVHDVPGGSWDLNRMAVHVRVLCYRRVLLSGGLLVSVAVSGIVVELDVGELGTEVAHVWCSLR